MSEDETQEQPPPEPDGEIRISSEYDKEDDSLLVGAKLKVRSMMDQFSRMQMVEMIFRALAEKIASDFFENWSEEIYEQLDMDEIVRLVKEEVVRRMADRVEGNMAQALVEPKEKESEDGGVQSR